MTFRREGDFLIGYLGVYGDDPVCSGVYKDHPGSSPDHVYQIRIPIPKDLLPPMIDAELAQEEASDAQA